MCRSNRLPKGTGASLYKLNEWWHLINNIKPTENGPTIMAAKHMDKYPLT